jgi:hypothetical protein
VNQSAGILATTARHSSAAAAESPAGGSGLDGVTWGTTVSDDADRRPRAAI